MTSIRSYVHTAIWMLSTATEVSGGSMAAWWTDIGPSLLVQDDSSGGIRYSLCNSQDTPILPADKTITAPLYKYKPKNGTALAGAGWWDSTTTWASIFYQDETDELVNSVLKCDTSTGYWSNMGDYQISGSSPSVSPNTGLAAVLLGSTDGYRVYYHDTDNSVHEIGYTQDTEWAEKGAITRDTGLGSALAAGFTGKNKNITVISPKGTEDLETSQWHDDSSWHVRTFPRPLAGNLTVTNGTNASSIALNQTSAPALALPGWDGSPGGLGLAVDKAANRSLFYIGTDAELHQLVSAASAPTAWQLPATPRQNATIWPRADGPKANLAVASSNSGTQLRVFYMSGGTMVQLVGDGNKWAVPSPLPSANSTAAKPTPSAGTSSSASATAAAAADTGLSAGAKAGIGVGVAVAVLGVAGLVGVLLFLRRQRRRRNQQAAAPSGWEPGSSVAGSTAVGSPAPAYAPSAEQYPGWQYTGQGDQGGWEYKPATEKPPGELGNNQPVAHEIAPSPERYEMPNSAPHHEMMGEGHYRELR